MVTKQHLTPVGFSTVLSYYASINNGMSPKVLSDFPNVVGVDRENHVLFPERLNPRPSGRSGFQVL